MQKKTAQTNIRSDAISNGAKAGVFNLFLLMAH